MSKAETRIAEALENIYMQLRRLNDGRDQFHLEVLDVLTAAKRGEPGPCPEWSPVLAANEVQSCRLRAGHDGMHESRTGMAWDTSGSLRSEQPAAAQQCGRRADLATADDGSSVWFSCVLDRGHADFHTDGRGVEWITTPAATSQQEGGDGAPNMRP